MRQFNTILTIIIFNTATTYACTCEQLNKLSKVEYTQAAAIFIGRVTKVNENRNEWKQIITLEIIRHLKPDSIVKKEITIITALDAAACGLPMTIGDKWYILTDSNLNVHLCGRSVHLNRKFKLKDEIHRLPPYYVWHLWRKEIKRYKKDKKFIRQINSGTNAV